MKTMNKKVEAIELDGLTGWRYRFLIVIILLCLNATVGMLYYSIFLA